MYFQVNSIQITEAVARVDAGADARTEAGADAGDISQYFDNIPLMSVSDLNFVHQRSAKIPA